MPATAMVFDVGRVLIGWDPEKLYEQIIPDVFERRRFLGSVATAEWNVAFDAGRPIKAGVAADAAANPEHADHISAWWERWPEMVGPPIDGSVACLRALKDAGVPVYGLTNFADETFTMAQKIFPFLNEFDECVVSGREYCVKPDPRIYALLEARTGCAPADLFFADDSPANIRAARQRGWTAHLFEGAAGLVAALEAEGLLPVGAARAIAP